MCGRGYTSGNTNSGRVNDTARRVKGETHPTQRVALSGFAVTILLRGMRRAFREVLGPVRC